MSNVLVEESSLQDIADSIRAKNGTANTYKPAEMSAAIDALPTGGGTMQSKSVSYTPTETAQSGTVTPDTGYDGLSSVSVSVGAIDDEYVGSAVTRRSIADLDLTGATFTAPAGFYASNADKTMMTGHMSVSATKGTVSNHSVTVTPKAAVDNAGYFATGDRTGTAVSVSASELVSGSETKTQNGTYDVTNLAELVVNVSGQTPTGTKNISITANGTTTEDVAAYANAQIAVNVPNSYSASDEGKVVDNGALVAQGSDTVTVNGTYDTTLINSLTVNVSGGLPGRLIKHIEFTPTTRVHSGNRLTFDLEPNIKCVIALVIDTYPSAPDPTYYIALYWGGLILTGNGLQGNGGNAILRPAGTIGTDGNICAFTRSTGKLAVGGQYGSLLAGTKYHIYQIEVV